MADEAEKLPAESAQERALRIWQGIDVDGSGSIDLGELKAHVKATANVDGAMAERIFASIDANDDGEIELSEWLAHYVAQAGEGAGEGDDEDDANEQEPAVVAAMAATGLSSASQQPLSAEAEDGSAPAAAAVLSVATPESPDGRASSLSATSPALLPSPRHSAADAHGGDGDGGNKHAASSSSSPRAGVSPRASPRVSSPRASPRAASKATPRATALSQAATRNPTYEAAGAADAGDGSARGSISARSCASSDGGGSTSTRSPFHKSAFQSYGGDSPTSGRSTPAGGHSVSGQVGHVGSLSLPGGKSGSSSARVSKPEAAHLLQRAQAAVSTPRAAVSPRSKSNSARGASGAAFSAAGLRSARRAEKANEARRQREEQEASRARQLAMTTGVGGGPPVFAPSSPLSFLEQQQHGAFDEVQGKISVTPGELYRMRNEFEEKLRLQRRYAERLEAEIEELRPRQAEIAHTLAGIETTKSLTKLRAKQKQQLSLHNRIHEQAEAERKAFNAKEIEDEKRLREALRRCKAETAAASDALWAQRMEAFEEKTLEKARVKEERTNALWQKRLDHANDERQLEIERADNLQRELENERGMLHAARVEADRLRKDKADQLKEAQARAVSERNAAIAYEQHKAEMVLYSQKANEAARADVMRLKTKSADEISAMASQALKLAEGAKAKVRPGSSGRGEGRGNGGGGGGRTAQVC